MCLIAFRTEKVQIAKEPIPVWKWVDRVGPGTYRAPYQPQQYYRRGGHYRIKKLGIQRTTRREKYKTVNEGFHAYTRREGWNERIKFIIPRGARYLRSCGGDQIVSNRIYLPRRKK